MCERVSGAKRVSIVIKLREGFSSSFVSRAWFVTPADSFVRHVSSVRFRGEGPRGDEEHERHERRVKGPQKFSVQHEAKHGNAEPVVAERTHRGVPRREGFDRPLVNHALVNPRIGRAQLCGDPRVALR